MAGRRADGPGRAVAFDHLRGLVVALVVLHHAVLAYCTFGRFNRQHYDWSTAPVVDAERWVGFDLLALFNDGYFMPLMFLLAGLFVWPGLARKGTMPYLRGRLLRLGLPFAVAALTLMPLAYYPSFLMTGADIGFARFWVQTVSAGPWPSGPAWFIAVLLAFDLAAACVHALVRRRQTMVLPRPGACFGWLAALSAVATVPLLAAFGPARWLTFGPFAVQASRVLLYALYFSAGVAAGCDGLERGPLAPGGPLQRRWAGWALLALLLFPPLVAVDAAWLAASAALPALAWPVLAGGALALFCAAAVLALLAAFLRFARPGAGWDGLGANAYGIYLLHYPIVTWAQYALLGQPWGAVLKGAAVFPAALLLSWGGASLLRRIPGAARVV